MTRQVTIDVPNDYYVVLVAPDLAVGWATRTNEGYKIIIDWGEPNHCGVHCPKLSVDYTDKLSAVVE